MNTTSSWCISRLVGCLAIALGSTPVAAQAPTLDSLVAIGLRANLSLTQGRLAVERTTRTVAAAQAARWPTLTFQARYTERSGATTDIGRLINPAFGTLNQLLGEARFPTDVSLALPLKQETGFRMTQPLFVRAIGATTAAARAASRAEQARLDGETERIAARIRIGYLDFLRAVRVAETYDSTLVLVEENLRVNERLLAAGSGTPDQVLRARAEREAVRQAQIESHAGARAARRQVNLLLHRMVEAPVDAIPDSLLGLDLSATPDAAVASALARRDDLAQIDAGISGAQAQIRLARASFLPSVSAALDYGIQGDRYRLGARHDYALATVVVQWNLFNGGRDRAQLDEARTAAEQWQARRLEATDQIEFEVRTAYDAAVAARQAIAAATARVVAARRTHELLTRRFAEGAATLVDYLDARVSRTSAELNLINTTYQFYQRCAELDRAATLRRWSAENARETP